MMAPLLFYSQRFVGKFRSTALGITGFQSLWHPVNPLIRAISSDNRSHRIVSYLMGEEAETLKASK